MRYSQPLGKHDNAKPRLKQSNKMVPRAGLEPARSKERGILNPLCLPISPSGRWEVLGFNLKKMEAEVGIEPASTDLQSAA